MYYFWFIIKLRYFTTNNSRLNGEFLLVIIIIIITLSLCIARKFLSIICGIRRLLNIHNILE